MKIAIDIDLIRDWRTSLKGTYAKQIDGEWECDFLSTVPVENLWLYFQFPQYIEIEQKVDENGEEYVGFIETSLVEDENAEYIPNEIYFNNFMNDNILEIFGHAKEKEPNTILFLNNIQKTYPDIEITLYSLSKGKAKSATLFFLSKCGCELNQIRFVTDVYYELSDMEYVLDQQSLGTKKIKDLDFKKLS